MVLSFWKVNDDELAYMYPDLAILAYITEHPYTTDAKLYKFHIDANTQVYAKNSFTLISPNNKSEMVIVPYDIYDLEAIDTYQINISQLLKDLRDQLKTGNEFNLFRQIVKNWIMISDDKFDTHNS